MLFNLLFKVVKKSYAGSEEAEERAMRLRSVNRLIFQLSAGYAFFHAPVPVNSPLNYQEISLRIS